MEEPSIPPQQRSNTLVPLSEYCCEIIFNLIWAIVFWSALAKPEFEECTEPVWFWGHYGKYYYTGNVIAEVVCFFVLNPIFSRTSGLAKTTGLFLILLIITICRLSGAVLTVGIFISYPHRLECPPLTTILTVQFVLILISLGVLAILCCCLVIMVAAVGSQPDQPGQQRPRSRPFMTGLQAMFPIFRLFQGTQNYANMP